MPIQRGNVSISVRQAVNAILLVAGNDRKWRRLAKRFGSWHPIHMRMNLCVEAGVLDRPFEGLQHRQLSRIRIEAVSLGSTIVNPHPDGSGAQKPERKLSVRPETDGRPEYIGLPRMIGPPSRAL